MISHILLTQPPCGCVDSSNTTVLHDRTNLSTYSLPLSFCGIAMFTGNPNTSIHFLYADATLHSTLSVHDVSYQNCFKSTTTLPSPLIFFSSICINLFLLSLLLLTHDEAESSHYYRALSLNTYFFRLFLSLSCYYQTVHIQLLQWLLYPTLLCCLFHPTINHNR